jgi:hypothetical protein
MKTVKRIMLFCAIIVSTTTSFGQENHDDKNMTPEERATKRTEKMKAELSLTEAQTTEIYSINLAHIKEMDKLREEQKVLHEKMKAEKEATRTKIKAILTAEQNIIFDQKAEEHKKKQEEKRKERQD